MQFRYHWNESAPNTYLVCAFSFALLSSHAFRYSRFVSPLLPSPTRASHIMVDSFPLQVSSLAGVDSIMWYSERSVIFQTRTAFPNYYGLT